MVGYYVNRQSSSKKYGGLTDQKLHLPVMLTRHTFSNFLTNNQTSLCLVNLRFCLFIKIESHSQVENYTRTS